MVRFVDMCDQFVFPWGDIDPVVSVTRRTRFYSDEICGPPLEQIYLPVYYA